MYKNSLVIIRTKKDSIVGCHMVFTQQYQADNPNQFDYKGHKCREFEISDTVGGKVVITTQDYLENAEVPITNTLEFDNVTKIDMLTTHTIKCGAYTNKFDNNKYDHTVVFDFDGVIHSYKSGWKGSTVIHDPPVEGIDAVLKELKQWGYNIVVSSSRCADHASLEAVNDWMLKHNLLQYVDLITDKKPPALCYVDDRAICFRGDTKNLVEQIKCFEPWHGEILDKDDDTFNYFKPEKGLPAIKFITNRLSKWNEYVPYEFELFKDVEDNRFYIGDGKTPLSQLVGHPIKNYSMPVIPCAVDDEVYIITERDGIVKDTITKIWSQGKQWIASTRNSNYTYNLSEDFEKVIFHDPILAYLVYQHNGLEGSENK